MTDPVMLLSQLHGEGRVTFRALRAAGFYTLASIAEAPVQALADRAHLSARTARRLKTGAEEMVGKGIGQESPETEAAAARAGGYRGGRRSPRRATIWFSEGVLLEEAALLGQGDRATAPRAHDPGEPPETPAPVLDDPNPMAQHAAGIDVGSRIAAAAEAAAGLFPAATPLPASAGVEPLSQSRTFWGFG